MFLQGIAASCKTARRPALPPGHSDPDDDLRHALESGKKGGGASARLISTSSAINRPPSSADNYVPGKTITYGDGGESYGSHGPKQIVQLIRLNPDWALMYSLCPTACFPPA